MASLKEILKAAKAFGIKKIIPIIRYNLNRDRLNRSYIKKSEPYSRLLPGKLIKVKKSISGANFQFENCELQIVFLKPDLVQLTWEPGVLPIPYAISKTDWPTVETTLKQIISGWELISPELSIQLDSNGFLFFVSNEGMILRQELLPILEETPLEPRWLSQSYLFPEECIYGLGEQTTPLNRRGSRSRLWNSDPFGAYQPGDDPIYMPLPVYLGLHKQGGYLVFYENYYPGTIQFDASTQKLGDRRPIASAEFEGGALRYYFIPGEPAHTIQTFTELTGRPALPPRWSLGYHQSRWGYKTEADIRRVVKGFHEHDLPLSAIHLDIDYMDGYRVFTVDQHRFPNFSGLVNELDQQGIKVVTILDPGVKQDPKYPVYQDGLTENAFCRLTDGQLLVGVVWPGWTVFPDFTDPHTRQWWGKGYKHLIDAGVAGFWHDMNEPTSFAIANGPYLPLETRHMMEGQGGDHRQGHNLYALLMNRAGYESWRSRRPTQRPWFFSRAGWVSQTRYAWNWTGDACTSWDSLRMTIPHILGTGLSGQPYNGPDIGGYSGNPSAELYLRWFQMAAFLPFFRTHSAQHTQEREPWSYGEPYTSIIRKFLQLRYRLLPYLYTLAWESSQTGHPLVRPLFWINPSEPALWEIEDQFLLGDDILIAPILEPGQTKRQITLPKGHWTNFWNNEVFSGPANLAMESGLENMPVFIRAGSLIPLAGHESLELHLYPPEQEITSNQSIYNDAGDGYEDWRVDRFKITRQNQSVEIDWENEGNFPFSDRPVELVLHDSFLQQAWMDDIALPLLENRVKLPELAGMSRLVKLILRD